MQAIEDDFWTYPLREGDTLASNEWVELHIHRLLTSRFIAYALREDRRADIGTALILWSECYRQDPAGTLPDDDVELAQLAKFGTDVEAWQRVRAGVLHGWRACHVETEAGYRTDRLGHPFIAEIAERSVKRKKGRAQGREAARLAVTRSRVRQKMKGMAGLARVAASAQAVEAIVGWLDDNQLFVTEDNIRAGAEAAVGVLRVVPYRRGEGGSAGESP
jgi:hypothetical protein